MGHTHEEDLIIKVNWGRNSLEYELFKDCLGDDAFDVEVTKGNGNSDVSAVVKILYKKTRAGNSGRKINKISDQTYRLNFSRSKDTHFVLFDITNKDLALNGHKRGHTTIIIGGGGGNEEV